MAYSGGQGLLDDMSSFRWLRATRLHPLAMRAAIKPYGTRSGRDNYFVISGSSRCRRATTLSSARAPSTVRYIMDHRRMDGVDGCRFGRTARTCHERLTSAAWPRRQPGRCSFYGGSRESRDQRLGGARGGKVRKEVRTRKAIVWPYSTKIIIDVR
jgi:hypothetical protein